MKKFTILFLLCAFCLVSGCNGVGVEEIKREGPINEFISSEEAFGYKYSLSIVNSEFVWEIGYKDDVRVFKENEHNKEALDGLYNAIINSHLSFKILLVWASLTLIYVTVAVYLYKKKRKIFKEILPVIIVAISISFYLSFENIIELTSSLRDMKYYYLSLLHLN